MTSEKRINYWIVAVIAFCFFLYLISDILLPFVFGIFVAYFLDPLADKLEEKKFSRTGATAFILATFFSVVIAMFMIVVPMLAEQLLSIASKIPFYTEMLNNKLEPKLASILEKFDGEALQKIKTAVGDASGYAFSMLGKVLGNVWQSGVAVLNLMSLILISPVVAFYILRDWDDIVAKIDHWLPRKKRNTIRKIILDIDDAIAGFVRGQASVILLLSIYYVIALSIMGLESALVVGLVTGLLAIIPYLGVAFGFIIAATMAFLQFGDVTPILYVLGIFVLGQMVEGNFVTPKLVGDRVGLHPVWIIFGMLAGGSLFGFVGILLAIPVTAVIGVLSRFFIGEYLKSPAYSGGVNTAKKTTKRKKK